MADMAKTAYVNVRMDKALKAEAEKVFADVGVKPSDALTIFYKQAILRQGIPFDICTHLHIPNAKTRKAIRDLEAGKGEVFTGSTKELFDKLTGRSRRT